MEEVDLRGCDEAKRTVVATQTNKETTEVLAEKEEEEEDSKLKNPRFDATFGLATPSLVALLNPASSSEDLNAPQLDLPQRVGHPCNLNAPKRELTATRGDQIKQKFASKAYASSSRRGNAGTLTRLCDLEILGRSARRAGKFRQEANAFYSMGVLFDNKRNWKKAVECYSGYLSLCKKLEDYEGISVAFNCLGVANFNAAVGEEGANRVVGLSEGEGKNAESSLKASMEYHERHFDSADEPGRYVALCNLGLCASRLGMAEKAVEYHQQSLKLAIELESPHGQSLAVGNLALASMQLGDLEAAKACMDKHLLLVRDLHNPVAEVLACQQLAQMAASVGDSAAAMEFLRQARECAVGCKDSGMLTVIDCGLGVADGASRADGFLKSLAASIED